MLGISHYSSIIYVIIIYQYNLFLESQVSLLVAMVSLLVVR
jgi:hypothetical protein